MQPENLMKHPGHLARRLQQLTYLLWNDMVSAEVTPPQFVVLNGILAEPGIDQRRLGARVSLDRSTLADVVARLNRRGLLERVRDTDDARRNVLRLTTAGRAVLEEIAVAANRMNQVLLAPLNQDEQATLMGLLERVIASGERLKNPEEIPA
jgi:MarR family transcriptional regulator, temperature-dependent positive regulator of motility